MARVPIPSTSLLFVLLLAAQQNQGEAVRAVVLEAPDGTRVEHFRLDRRGEAGPGRALDRAPIGLVRWISGPDPETHGGWRVENEVLFLSEATRVQHTERLHPFERKLVWREVRERSGRTVRLQWTPEGLPVSFDTVGGPIRRRDLTAEGKELLPLALVEFVRSGEQWWSGNFRVFQPLANDFEDLDVRVEEHEDGERVLEMRRKETPLSEGTTGEGILTGRYHFRNGALVLFQWQEGGPVATPIDPAEYERLRGAAPKRLSAMAEREPRL